MVMPALICYTSLPQFVINIFFVINFSCSYRKFFDIGWGNLTHRVTLLIDRVVFKKTVSPFPQGQWPPTLVRL